MARMQLALNVSDIGQATTFYTKLFGTEPAKVRPGYANYAIASPPLKLVLIENPAQAGTLNHLGIEVPDTATVQAEQGRLSHADVTTTDPQATTCCYAEQDKFWVQDTPDGTPWEVYTVLADSAAFGSSSATGTACCDSSAGPAACC